MPLDGFALNQLAQGLLKIEDGVAEFVNEDADRRRATLRKLIAFALQAGVKPADTRPGIERAGIKATDTPSVLISKGAIQVQLAKIANLPESESVKSFRLLVALFAIADERRRNEKCLNGCSHWWHNLEN